MRFKRCTIVLVLLAALLASAPPAGAQQPLGEADSLAGLCKVWGLLKYYHPEVAARDDWDQVLIAAVPRFKSSTTRQAFNREVVALVGDAGIGYVFRELSVAIPRGTAAASLGRPFAWMDDRSLYEPATALLLKAIVLAHRPGGANRWVAGTGNPDFTGDQGYYSSVGLPSEEIRLLALFRFWNMVHYFAPCNDVMDRDWDEGLGALIPRFRQASTALEYNLAVLEMTASINDAHAATGSATINTFWGVNSAPILTRLVENRTVITKTFPRLLSADLRVGDIITHVDGIPVESRRAEMKRWVNASNEASLERNIHSNLFRTNNSRLSLTVQRDRPQAFTVDVECASLAAIATEQAAEDGVVSAILPANIGYLHLGRLPLADVTAVMAGLKNTRALVIDIRNYPQGTLYAVSNYIHAESKPFVKFLEPDYTHPGLFVWRGPLYTGPNSPNAWAGSPAATYTYNGRIVVLVNQETQSQAEYTAMAFRTVPGAVVMGSQTAGADGNVSLIRLPGGIATYFSGLGVFYPDGSPTQRIGIAPDIQVTPTIRGLREGRDEVLDAALQLLR